MLTPKQIKAARFHIKGLRMIHCPGAAKSLELALDTIEAKDATIAALKAENEGLRTAAQHALDCWGEDAFITESDQYDVKHILRAALSPAPQAPESL